MDAILSAVIWPVTAALGVIALMALWKPRLVLERASNGKRTTIMICMVCLLIGVGVVCILLHRSTLLWVFNGGFMVGVGYVNLMRWAE